MARIALTNPQRRNAKPKQTQITFNTQLKTAAKNQIKN